MNKSSENRDNQKQYKLPKVLYRYEGKDFATQLKVRFIFYLVIFLIACMTIVSTIAYIIKFNDPNYVGSYYPILIVEISIILVFCICLYVLIRGFFNIAAHAILILSSLAVWLVMFLDKNDTIAHLDTIEYLLVVLSTTPIIVEKKKRAIFYYISVNFLILLAFVYFFNSTYKINQHDILDFLLDSSVCIIFIGIVAYNNFRISSISLNKALEDIKEREIAEQALSESEKKYRELMESLPQTVFETKLDGSIIYSNKNGFELFGYNEFDIKNGMNVMQIIAPEDRILAIENIKKIISGQKIIGYEYKAIKQDGTIFPIQIYTNLVTENNRPVGFRGVIIDITEQRKTQESLKQSQELFKNLIELLPHSIMVSDFNDTFILVNNAFCTNLGYNIEEVIGKSRDELGLLMEIENAEEAYEKLRNEGHVENIEMQVTGKNKVKNNVYFSSRIIKMNDQLVRLSTTVNVTEKKKIEQELDNYRKNLENLVIERTEELNNSNNALKDSNEELTRQREELQTILNDLNNAHKQLMDSEKMASLGVLAAGVAHEINNPLNYIKGGIVGLEDYINDHFKTHLDELAPLISAINVGIDRASKIVTSLNHYSRKTESITEKCDIHTIIDHCLTMMQNQLKYKVSIEKKYTLTKFYIIGNDGKLHQVLLNIITNAANAIDSKGNISITTNIIDKKLEITIIDTGQGISQENLPKIFDPFFTTKEPGKGTGLGLSISYKIIKEHNGNINIDSQIGKGTKVIITLPAILEK